MEVWRLEGLDAEGVKAWRLGGLKDWRLGGSEIRKLGRRKPESLEGGGSEAWRIGGLEVSPEALGGLLGSLLERLGASWELS